LQTKPDSGAGTSPPPVESPSGSRLTLEDCSLWKGLTLEPGKTVRRRERQRGAVRD